MLPAPDSGHVKPRRRFLAALFAGLDQRQVAYCVQRNYERIYDDPSSDVDLIVEPANVPLLTECLTEAAVGNGHRLVLCTRYVNYSRVYWHPEGGFLRIDFDTEVRWRIFPVLSAEPVVAQRRRQGGIHIPHPCHESIILWVAALWRGHLSERYRAQLARLTPEIADPEEMKRTFRSAFGAAGETLATFQREIDKHEFNCALCHRAKRSIIWNALANGPKRAAMLAHLRTDLARLWERLRRPAGISLFHLSSATAPRRIEDWITGIEPLFPAKKSTFLVSMSADEIQTSTKLAWPEHWGRLRTLFKGGLFVRRCRVKDDPDLKRAVSRVSRCLYPSRTFVCVENSRGEVFLAHVGTGFMKEVSTSGKGGAGTTDGTFVEFIASVLGRHELLRPSSEAQGGVFAVLVGLDGSGKTTLARAICCEALNGDRFGGVRYNHWRPRGRGQVEFPLPDYATTPRKQPERHSALNSLLSLLRLLKNAVLARLAYGVVVRPLLRRNYLVLVDRYFYNYYLDPVSVRYYSSARWLQRLAPVFPQPDAVITLEADAETLVKRKRELSPEEIQQQAATLRSLQIPPGRHVRNDATQPPAELARFTLARLAAIHSRAADQGGNT